MRLCNLSDTRHSLGILRVLGHTSENPCSSRPQFSPSLTVSLYRSQYLYISLPLSLPRTLFCSLTLSQHTKERVALQHTSENPGSSRPQICAKTQHIKEKVALHKLALILMGVHVLYSANSIRQQSMCACPQALTPLHLHDSLEFVCVQQGFLDQLASGHRQLLVARVAEIDDVVRDAPIPLHNKNVCTRSIHQ